MAQLPNLDNAPINLSVLREKAQKELVRALDSMYGKKVLYLDPKLSGPLALIAQTSLLKDRGVENLFHLNSDPLQSECANVLYIVRPRISLMKHIAEQIRRDRDKKVQKQYSVYFVPRRTLVCEKVLDEKGVLNSITVGEFSLHFIPFDEDVLSLELDTAYKECQVEGDTSALWYVARAISNLQLTFGVIHNIKAKGKSAIQVAEILNRMQQEQPGTTFGAGEIDSLILLDRQVDLVTPMCSQLTYEGLIDECLHINNGAVEVDATIMGAPQNNKKMKTPLNSSDKLYRELRDLNFGIVGQVLQQKATSMKNDYAEVTTMNQSVSELKDFVKKLNVLPEMTRHINLAQHLSTTYTTKASFLERLSIEQTLVEGLNYEITYDYIEAMIHKQDPLINVLRLLVLLSLTNGGLPKKHFDNIRRELLHSYGFEFMILLSNLEKAGLVKKQEGKNNWQHLKKVYKLVVEDVDDANPKDIAYVFSGYAPLSIRIVENALKDGWLAAVRAIPGPQMEWPEGIHTASWNQSSHEISSKERNDSNGVFDGRRSLVLVMFIGGVTFAEISALRFLNSQEGMKYDLMVATTKLINGTSLLQTLVEDPSKDN